MDIKQMGTKELREDLGRRVDAAYYMGEPTVVTRNGVPRAVLVPYAEWEKCRQADAAGDQSGA